MRLTADGAGLEAIPASPAARSRGLLQADTRLDESGGLRSRTDVQGGGYYDFILRGIGRRFSGPQLIQVWQELAGKLNGLAVRVPTPNVSLVDLVVAIDKSGVTVSEVNAP